MVQIPEGVRGWMPDRENMESLKVNGAVVTDKEEMRKVIKEFLEEIGDIGEVFSSETQSWVIFTPCPLFHVSTACVGGGSLVGLCVASFCCEL